MPRKIVIEPVTRIEGHAKVTIHLGDDGRVTDARLHVMQFRGFEGFTQGRPFQEMPAITSRICGICPVSHSLASARACDELMAVRIPATAANLRRVLNLAQLIQSHALSFFHLSAPDFLIGLDAPPAQRNILGLVQTHPDAARDGIWLRRFGQQAIERLAGKRIHPSWVVAGGVNAPLSADVRDGILAQIPHAVALAQRAIDMHKDSFESHREEISAFASFPTMFLGLVGPDGTLEHYDGKLRIVSADRTIIADQIEPGDYSDYISEAAVPWSYLKMPFYAPVGLEQGCYRVGPLARLNVADRCGTPLADAELEDFRRLGDGAVLSSYYYHYARLIELLYALERVSELLNDPGILSTRIRAQAEPNEREGIGVIEAPRGTLIHHYRIADDGLIQWVNLIVATGHNSMAMNRGILQTAQRFVHGERLTEGALNRVEAVIRCFDPCLSCATHALGQMPIHIKLLGPDGACLDERRRSSDGQTQMR